MKNFIIYIFAALLICSCAKYAKTEEASADGITDEAVTESQLASTPKVDLYSDGKTKLIKEAEYKFEVKSVKESTVAIETALKKYPAYVSSSSLKLENPILQNKMTIRIQSEYFSDLLQDIDKQAVFVNVRNVETDDVSKEFVDLESRLSTKREVEARYAAILRNKAGTIQELLDAEKQIGALHEEIEATVSRINYLRDQVSYSSINLEFYQSITETIAKHENPLSNKFADAFSTGLQGMIALGLGIVYIWPVVFLIATMLLFWMYKKRRLLKV